MPTQRRTTRGTRSRQAPPEQPEPPDEPIVLTGPPAMLRSTVTVENLTGSRLTVRGTALHLQDGPVAVGTAAALIRPGATTSVPVSIPLDPSTRPGTYAAELDLNGARRGAVVHVEAHPSLAISPKRLLCQPGGQAVTLTVTNDGNVDMPIAARALARSNDGGSEPGPDVELILDSAVTVQPGETATLSGTLAVPETLDPARRHTAVVPVGVADLTVIILPRRPTEQTS